MAEASGTPDEPAYRRAFAESAMIILPLALGCLTRQPPAAPPLGPAGESAWGCALRWMADRRRLGEMDERLLCDIGLTRADLARGLPFRRSSAGGDAQVIPGRDSARVRA